MPTVIISSIICEVPQESDKDEIFLMFKSKKIWPKAQKFHKIDVDERAPINLKVQVKAKGVLKIELWEYDLTKKNDHLGTFHLKIGNEPGEFSEMLDPYSSEFSEVSYFLNWKLVL
ncbi:MAG: hypothetical protein RIC35_01870 [Marinoscillum sp.]